jgi:hypothetical protein
VNLVILLQWTQPFWNNAHLFLWFHQLFCYSEHNYFCYSEFIHCICFVNYFAIVNSDIIEVSSVIFSTINSIILLQCSVILWFRQSFSIFFQSFCYRAQPFCKFAQSSSWVCESFSRLRQPFSRMTNVGAEARTRRARGDSWLDHGRTSGTGLVTLGWVGWWLGG